MSDGTIEPVLPPAGKPGWQTTEFWVTAVLNLLALLVAGGVLTRETSDQLGKGIEYLGLAVTALAAAYANAKYSVGRSNVKAEATRAEATYRATVLRSRADEYVARARIREATGIEQSKS